jgi:glutathione S-transferase
MTALTLIGHRLCPYVQRVDMALRETGLDYRREDIELDRKPDWLGRVSPGGTVPVLQVGEDAWLFESASIALYIDIVSGGQLSPVEALDRARAEAWMRVGDDLLRIIAQIIYRDQTEAAMHASLKALSDGLTRVSEHVLPAPYLGGERFGLLDAVYVTIFRYLPVFGRLGMPPTAEHWVPRWAGWWQRVQMRASVRQCVPETFEAELIALIAGRSSLAAKRLAPMGVALD